MAANRTVWGIDMGQCALKAIRLRLEGDKVEAVDHVYIEHPRILSQPEADRKGMIAEAMKTFTSRHDLSKEILVVSVPGQETLARFCKLPPVDKKKIPEIVQFEAQQQIPFDMDDVIWDYQVFADGDSVETQVGIFAMRREKLHEQLRFLTDLNLEPAAVQAAPLALYNALRFDGIVGKEPVVILDIGTQNTDLIVAEGDSLWSRTIPIGGNNFTEALLKTFKLSFNKAERLKREAQKHKYARQIFQAMRPVFADLVAEIQRSIGFFTSLRRGVKLERIIAMGNAFQLPGMSKFVQQNLGMEVVRPTSFEKLGAASAADAPELMKQLHGFGVAYGLALQGLNKAVITSNLLPPEIAKQIVWRKKDPWFYGAVAALVLAATGVWARQLIDQGALSKARGSQLNFNYSITYDPKDEKQVNPMLDPAALEVLQKGPSADSPFGKGQQVYAVGQHLDEVLRQITTKIEDDITKAQNIAKLQSQKAVWPKIIHMVHGAIPAPDPRLLEAMGAGPEAYKTLVTTNPEFERQNRRELYIERFESEFATDVMAMLADRKGGQHAAGMSSAAGQPDATAGSGVVSPGFVIRLVGRTPFAQASQFLNETLLAGLNKAKEPAQNLPDARVYFTGVHLVRVNKASDPGMPAAASTGGGPGGGRPTLGLAGSSGITAAGTEARDPITGESTASDAVFEVIFAAVLGAKPEENAQPGGGT